MGVLIKIDYRRAGLCIDCGSKFAIDTDDLCWDCLYARYAKEGFAVPERRVASK